MKHESTQALFDYWNRKRGTRPAPDRAEIDPGAIRHALGDTFMLAADFVDQLRFRLAGTRVCALFNREIKGEEFRALWSEASVKLIDDLLTVVNNESVGAVAGLTGRTEDGTQIDLEMMLLPLAHTGHARIRALGVLVPLTVPYWLGEKPVAELELGTLRHIGSDLETHLAPRLTHATEAVELRHGFVVYSGGREVPPGKKTG
ncbi:MAG: PAS domain-containing protein [Pseudolabrys sp.]